jgi:hypothetical protein
MNFRFVENDDLAAIARLNNRLKAAGSQESMTLEPGLSGEWHDRPSPVYRRMMIAEDGQEVRAALLLSHHSIFIHGEKRDFCWADMPLSEGIIDPRYSLAIVQLMKKAADYQPFLMTLGVGPPEEAAHRFLAKLGWRHQTVPFFFHPVRVNKALRCMRYFKNHPGLRYGAILGAFSGLGGGLSCLLAMKRKLSNSLSVKLPGYEKSVVAAFDDWADRLFINSLPDYPVAIRSDAPALNIIYPPDNHGYVRLRVRHKETKRDAGWIVVASKQMTDNAYFGNLKVGTLVDGIGRAADVPALVSVGLNQLVEMGVDMIVANFSHSAWVGACRRSGMFGGPSNYQIFVSPKAGPLLDETCPLHRMHISRGHGDGMDHLI